MGDVVEDPYRRVGAALATGGIAAVRDTDELAAPAELEFAPRFADRPEGFEELAGPFDESPCTWMTSGESLVALGDLEGARGAHQKAAEVAEERDDPTEVSGALEQLASFFDEHQGAKSRVGGACQRVRVTQDPEVWVSVRTTTALGGLTESVPRNAPCPCGSGREGTRCCGSPR